MSDPRPVEFGPRVCLACEDHGGDADHDCAVCSGEGWLCTRCGDGGDGVCECPKPAPVDVEPVTTRLPR